MPDIPNPSAPVNPPAGATASSAAAAPAPAVPTAAGPPALVQPSAAAASIEWSRTTAVSARAAIDALPSQPQTISQRASLKIGTKDFIALSVLVLAVGAVIVAIGTIVMVLMGKMESVTAAKLLASLVGGAAIDSIAARVVGKRSKGR